MKQSLINDMKKSYLLQNKYSYQLLFHHLNFKTIHFLWANTYIDYLCKYIAHSRIIEVENEKGYLHTVIRGDYV